MRSNEVSEVLKKSLNVSLNRELAIAPQGAIGFDVFGLVSTLYGSQ
jgi:hypothetical protein